MKDVQFVARWSDTWRTGLGFAQGRFLKQTTRSGKLDEQPGMSEHVEANNGTVWRGRCLCAGRSLPHTATP